MTMMRVWHQFRWKSPDTIVFSRGRYVVCVFPLSATPPTFEVAVGQVGVIHTGREFEKCFVFRDYLPSWPVIEKPWRLFRYRRLSFSEAFGKAIESATRWILAASDDEVTVARFEKEVLPEIRSSISDIMGEKTLQSHHFLTAS